MRDDHSVTNWIHVLRETNDGDAAQALWEKFQKRLLGVAARQLGGNVRGAGDADDVVNDAFASFYRRVEHGEYTAVNDRDGLWRLLLTITENKAKKQLRRELAQRRGAGKNRGDSIFYSSPQSEAGGGFDRFAAAEPTPDDVAVLHETMAEMLALLTEDEREIAIMRMESWSNTEIADRRSLSLATVERRLKKIREKWSELEIVEH